MAANKSMEISNNSSRLDSARVTVQRLKYSRITSSREANRMGRFQYPGDSKRPSKRVSVRMELRMSRRDLVGVGVVEREKALYFCFASTYL